jgi:hypothetical protein
VPSIAYVPLLSAAAITHLVLHIVDDTPLALSDQYKGVSVFPTCSSSISRRDNPFGTSTSSMTRPLRCQISTRVSFFQHPPVSTYIMPRRFK